MRLELNDKEYTYVPYSRSPKCAICAWKDLPTCYCIKFCRIGYIFRTTKIAPSVFIYESE